MRPTKFLPLILLPIILWLQACDTEDSPDVPFGEEIHLGGAVLTSQLTIIELGGRILQEQYMILLDDAQLTAHRISDTQLAFLMPADLSPGDHFVKIPALDNHTLHYAVGQTVLPQGAEAVMAPFFDAYGAAASLSALPTENHAQVYLDALMETFEALSPEDQQAMATYYYANRELFEGVLQDARSDKTAILIKYSLAVVAMGASVVIAWTDPEPISKSIFTLAAVLTFQKAKKLYHAFADQEIKAMEVRLDGIHSEFEKAPRAGKLEGGLEFSDGKAQEVSVGLSFRRTIAPDAQAPTGALVDFFASTALFNGGIDKLNTAIAFVNKNLFLSDIPLLEKNALPEQSAGKEVAMTPELFANISVSILASNVSLTTFELTQGMDLNIGLQIDRPMETEDNYVEGTLNLGYSDAFNGTTTSIPFRVNKSGLLLSGDMDFGEVALGETQDRTLTLVNTSERDIHINGINLPEDFQVDWGQGVLPALESKTVTVSFTPSQAKEYQGELIVINDVDDLNNVLPVSGTGTTNPYYGIWTAIAYRGESLNTWVVYPQDISCGTPDYEYLLENFVLTLDETSLGLLYAEQSRSYRYTYDQAESCATRIFEGMVPYSNHVDQTVPYAFDPSNGNQIFFEMTVDGEVLSMSMTFALQANGNLAMSMTHLEDGESHSYELQKM